MASIKKYSTKQGTMWRVQYRSPDGRSRTKRGFKTKSAATEWAARATTEIADGMWNDPANLRLPVGQLGEIWLETQTHLKPSTLRRTEQIWRIHVKPYWGHIGIGKIVPSEVQEWVSSMGGSASSRRKAHACLAQILDMAVMDKRLKTNPARGVKLPARTKSSHVYLTAVQLKQLVDCMPKYPELVYLLGTSGLRFSEAAALRVKDVDFLRRRIRVERAAVTIGADFAIGTPKTHERRTVAVADSVLESLAELCKEKTPDSLLWARTDGTPLRIPSHHHWYYVGLDKAMREYDLPRVTPHGLRHVSAGLLVSSGANVKVVQRQLGHASAAMTLDVYADLFDEDLNAVADALNETLSNVVKLSSQTKRTPPNPMEKGA